MLPGERATRRGASRRVTLPLSRGGEDTAARSASREVFFSSTRAILDEGIFVARIFRAYSNAPAGTSNRIESRFALDLIETSRRSTESMRWYRPIRKTAIQRKKETVSRERERT